MAEDSKLLAHDYGAGYQSFSKHKNPNDLTCECHLSARQASRMAEKTMVAESLFAIR